MRPLVLVTGATGFIGGRLAEMLIESGSAVRALVRRPERLRPTLRDRCECVIGDLRDIDSLRPAVDGIATLYHCAANVRTWDSDAAYRAANVDGVRNLLAAISGRRGAPVRLIHVSTVDVYGFPEQPCDESCPVDGGGFGYGETKLAAEALIRSHADRQGIPYTIIRPANVIGPNSPFIRRIGDALHHGVMLRVNGGRSNAGMLFVDNLVRYLIWAAGSPQAVNQTFNVRDPYDIDWADFCSTLKGLIKGRGLVIDLPYGVADGVATALERVHRRWLPKHEPLLHRLLVRILGRTCGHSAEKIRHLSGLGGLVTFEEAMKRSGDWYLNQRR